MNKDIYNKIYREKTINRISKKCKLLGSNSKIQPITFETIRLSTMLVLFFFLLIFLEKGFIYAPLISIILYFSFEYLLDYKIKKRSEKLNNEAIFFFQVLALTLESGRNLRGAIDLTTQNIDSEISFEFKKTLIEVDYGKSLTKALEDMKTRIPSEEINTVLLNITQSTIFGNNIIDSLNNQIEYLRDKKLLNIKSKINKMPIKISVISVIFIIPIILLLILGPVVINFLIK